MMSEGPQQMPMLQVAPRGLTDMERLRLVEIAATTTDARVKEHALRLLDAAGALLSYERPAPDVVRAQQVMDPPEGVRPVLRYADAADVRAMVRGHAPDLEPDGLAGRGS